MDDITDNVWWPRGGWKLGKKQSLKVSVVKHTHSFMAQDLEIMVDRRVTQSMSVRKRSSSLVQERMEAR